MTISPGVQVVADADEPLFFADGYYWLYRDGVWLRSDSYRGGFARIDVNVVPGEIRDIRQPQMYAHYRRHAGQQNYARGSQIRERQPARPQGTYQQPMQQQQQQQPQPGRTPTEPQPSTPSQQPPVPNPMPQSQGTPGAGTPRSPGAQGSQIPENGPGAPLPSQRDRSTDRDQQNGGEVTPPSSSPTPSDRGADRTKSPTDVDTNRSQLDKNKSGMDKSGMNREQNDANKDHNKKARGNDQNKQDEPDRNVDKKTTPN
ncbi:MAG: hypothetical protein ACM31C_16300 [Acidobacteriota bacterium]